MTAGAAIDLLARQHAPQVLAEALREARSRATAELTAQLTKAILAEATSAHRPPELEVPPDRGLCVYAITRDHNLDPATIPELHTASPPRLIAQDGLSLVVADVDLTLFTELDPDPAENGSLAMLARDHDAIVRAVFEHQPVLPLRFGTVVDDENAARQLLRCRHDEVTSSLDRVAGHREWSVRIGHSAEDKPAEVPLEGLTGTEYLLQRQHKLAGDERARLSRIKAAQSLHDKLSGQAADTTCRDHRPRTLLDAAYLVPLGNEASFQAEAARLAEPLGQLGATVHTTGPWPPYSFTRIELAVQG